VARVALRVKKGGHDVPTDKIVERWHKSHQEFNWFAHQVDEVAVWDNSYIDQPMRLVFRKTANGNARQYAPAPNQYIGDLVKQFMPQ
jgi:predicted ABC-type ATPase